MNTKQSKRKRKPNAPEPQRGAKGASLLGGMSLWARRLLQERRGRSSDR